EERQMRFFEVAAITFRHLCARPTGAAGHRLQLRIPVEDDGILFQVNRWLPIKNRFLPIFLEVDAFPEADALQILDHRKHELDAILVRRQALVFEVLLELAHVVRADAEDVERLQGLDVLGRGLPLEPPAALEREVLALEANTAPEELNDLRSLVAPDVHQAHGADPPA